MVLNIGIEIEACAVPSLFEKDKLKFFSITTDPTIQCNSVNTLENIYKIVKIKIINEEIKNISFANIKKIQKIDNKIILERWKLEKKITQEEIENIMKEIEQMEINKKEIKREQKEIIQNLGESMDVQIKTEKEMKNIIKDVEFNKDKNIKQLLSIIKLIVNKSLTINNNKLMRIITNLQKMIYEPTLYNFNEVKKNNNIKLLFIKILKILKSILDLDLVRLINWTNNCIDILKNIDKIEVKLLIPVEYVLKGVITSDQLIDAFKDYKDPISNKYIQIYDELPEIDNYDPKSDNTTIRDDIIQIEKNTSMITDLGREPNGCKMAQSSQLFKGALYTCGLHFHVSSELILCDTLIGLLFLINFLFAWDNSNILTSHIHNITYGKNISLQDYFLSNFLYQKNIFGDSYSDLNKLTTSNLDYLAEIKELVLSGDIIDENILIHYNTIKNIWNYGIDNTYSDDIYYRPYLTIIDDGTNKHGHRFAPIKYVHFEFRGLLPWDLQDQIPRFVEELCKVYTIIYNNTKLELLDHGLIDDDFIDVIS